MADKGIVLSVMSGRCCGAPRVRPVVQWPERLCASGSCAGAGAGHVGGLLIGSP